MVARAVACLLAIAGTHWLRLPSFRQLAIPCESHLRWHRLAPPLPSLPHHFHQRIIRDSGVVGSACPLFTPLTHIFLTHLYIVYTFTATAIAADDCSYDVAVKNFNAACGGGKREEVCTAGCRVRCATLNTALRRGL